MIERISPSTARKNQANLSNSLTLFIHAIFSKAVTFSYRAKYARSISCNKKVTHQTSFLYSKGV